MTYSETLEFFRTESELFQCFNAFSSSNSIETNYEKHRNIKNVRIRFDVPEKFKSFNLKFILKKFQILETLGSF
jgi:hypothetical protein